MLQQIFSLLALLPSTLAEACPKVYDKCNQDPADPVPYLKYKCWKELAVGNWDCQAYVNEDRHICAEGFQNTRTCRYDQPVYHCPRRENYCVIEDMAFRADDPRAPNCWHRPREGREAWDCNFMDNCFDEQYIDVKKFCTY